MFCTIVNIIFTDQQQKSATKRPSIIIVFIGLQIAFPQGNGFVATYKSQVGAFIVASSASAGLCNLETNNCLCLELAADHKTTFG